MNEDYNKKCTNFDNALTTYPLFCPSRSNAPGQCDQNIQLYHQYLQTAGSANIRSTNTITNNIIRTNSNVGSITSIQSLTNPDLTDVLDKAIKFNQTGGSTRVPNKLNICLLVGIFESHGHDGIV